jgi:hypothetical protein
VGGGTVNVIIGFGAGRTTKEMAERNGHFLELWHTGPETSIYIITNKTLHLQPLSEG